jgi:hypothetical protein
MRKIGPDLPPHDPQVPKSKRAGGFYWVRESSFSKWVVALWDRPTASWAFIGSPDADRQDSDLYRIDERRIVRD